MLQCNMIEMRIASSMKRQPGLGVSGRGCRNSTPRSLRRDRGQTWNRSRDRPDVVLIDLAPVRAVSRIISLSARLARPTRCSSTVGRRGDRASIDAVCRLLVDGLREQNRPVLRPRGPPVQALQWISADSTTPGQARRRETVDRPTHSCKQRLSETRSYAELRRRR